MGKGGGGSHNAKWHLRAPGEKPEKPLDMEGGFWHSRRRSREGCSCTECQAAHGDRKALYDRDEFSSSESS